MKYPFIHEAIELLFVVKLHAKSKWNRSSFFCNKPSERVGSKTILRSEPTLNVLN